MVIRAGELVLDIGLLMVWYIGQATIAAENKYPLMRDFTLKEILVWILPIILFDVYMIFGTGAKTVFKVH